MTATLRVLAGAVGGTRLGESSDPAVDESDIERPPHNPREQEPHVSGVCGGVLHYYTSRLGLV